MRPAAMRSFFDFLLNFHPHLRAIVPHGCFRFDGSFQMAPGFDPEDLEAASQYDALKMLQKNNATIENMLSWHHSGFHVYVGNRICPIDEAGLEKLAKYIVCICFSRQRMIYIPVEKSSNGMAKVIHTSKNGRLQKTFGYVSIRANAIVVKFQERAHVRFLFASDCDKMCPAIPWLARKKLSIVLG